MLFNFVAWLLLLRLSRSASFFLRIWFVFAESTRFERNGSSNWIEISSALATIFVQNWLEFDECEVRYLNFVYWFFISWKRGKFENRCDVEIYPESLDVGVESLRFVANFKCDAFHVLSFLDFAAANRAKVVESKKKKKLARGWVVYMKIESNCRIIGDAWVVVWHSTRHCALRNFKSWRRAKGI